MGMLFRTYVGISMLFVLVLVSPLNKVHCEYLTAWFMVVSSQEQLTAPDPACAVVSQQCCDTTECMARFLSSNFRKCQ